MRNLFLAILAVLCFASCDTKLSPKHILVAGELKPYFEVVNRDYKVTNGKTIIELKRVKEGMPAGWSETMSLGKNPGEYEIGFTIEYSDKKDVLFCKETSDITRDAAELKALVATKTGETATISFAAPDDAVSFSVISSFTLHQTSATPAASAPRVSAPVAPADPNHVQLAGNMAKAGKIYMKLDFNGSSVSGSYYYASTKSPLYISGTRSGNHITLTECNSSGEITGEFSGTYTGTSFSGTMTSYYSKTYGIDYSSPHYHNFNLAAY